MTFYLTTFENVKIKELHGRPPPDWSINLFRATLNKRELKDVSFNGIRRSHSNIQAAYDNKLVAVPRSQQKRKGQGGGNNKKKERESVAAARRGGEGDESCGHYYGSRSTKM